MNDSGPERKQGFLSNVLGLFTRPNNPVGLERRVADLEKKVGASQEDRLKEIQTRLGAIDQGLDRHKSVITWIFGIVSVVVAVVVAGSTIGLAILSSASRSETREATAAMERRVDKAIEDMKKDFQALAGDALKKPDLRIFVDSGLPLQGHEFVIGNGKPIPLLGTLFFTNAGTKATGPINLHLDCTVGATIGMTWLPIQTLDKEFPRRFESLDWRGFSIEPGNDYAFPNPGAYLNFDQAGVTNATFRLVVFYGDDKRAEAIFYLRRKD